MSSIETDYKGHSIRFNTNEDLWWCPSMNLSDKSFNKLCAKITKALNAEKKAESIPAIVVNDGFTGPPTVVEVKIIEYLGAPKDYKGKPQPRVAILHPGNSVAARGRKVISLDDLAPLGAATDAAIAEAVRLYAEAAKAEQAARAALKAVPRLTLDDIEKLVLHAMNSRNEQEE